MVLLTLLGLTALLLRERREVKNTYSVQDEKVDQSDLLPVGSTDGQTSQHTTSGPEVLHTEEEPTSPPKIDDDDAFYDFVGDASEWSAEVLHALNSVMCEFNVKSIDIPQVPVSAVSDCRVDVPQASDNPAVDTVAPQSSQLKDDEETIMDINACSDKISIQLTEGGFGTIYSGIRLDDGLKEGYSEPLQLELQHQHSEDKERDGASDNETKSDSEVPEVPVPADDTPEVLNKFLSGLSLRLKNWWERYTWEILTPAMISSFFFIFIVYLGPMALMMMPFLIKFFHQIITTGYRVYHCYHMPWFRTLSLYFLLCVSYFFYEEKITDYFFTVVQREECVHMLSKYHHFIPFALYLVGFCMIVLSLVKKLYRLPFCMFIWTHLTVLIVAIHSDLIIQNLLEEIIWFIAPISNIICNSIIDCMFGFILSHSL